MSARLYLATLLFTPYSLYTVRNRLTGHQPIARVCIGSVKGDLHDIGKNLVAMMLKGSGFEVEDLGVDCRIEDYEAAVQRGAQVVCLSALLSTTREAMRPVARI